MKRLFAILLLALPSQILGAIGCTLSNPAEDLKYLFPTMTTFREDLNEFPRLKDGPELFRGLKARLGSDLDPIYETLETPYTVYTVFAGTTKIGIVHGVNVPGKGGVIQVFLSVDPATSEIKAFFFQRLESSAAKQLRDKAFRAQFTGFTLADFYKHDYYAVAQPGTKADKLAAIKAPAPLETSGLYDYNASLRAIRKNLILLDFFVFAKRFEPFFERANEQRANQANRKD